MSMRIIIPTSLLIIALAGAFIRWPDSYPKIAGAANSSSPSPIADAPLNLAGTWTCNDGPIHHTYTLNPDGTCTYKIDLPAHIPQQPLKHGKWSLENDDTLLISFDQIASPTSHILADPREETRLAIHKDASSLSFGGTTPRTQFTRH